MQMFVSLTMKVNLSWLWMLLVNYDSNVAKSKHKSFSPTNIATDVNHNILINDSSYDIVHVIDNDGHFLRYIEFPCNGGMSIDRDHNLVVGEETSGKIRIIKYLQ